MVQLLWQQKAISLEENINSPKLKLSSELTKISREKRRQAIMTESTKTTVF